MMVNWAKVEMCQPEEILIYNLYRGRVQRSEATSEDASLLQFYNLMLFFSLQMNSNLDGSFNRKLLRI